MARDIPVAVRDEVWRRDSTPQDAACRYCGASVVHGVRRPAEAIRAHFDVVNPKLSATVDNVVVACPACNMRKGNRTPSEAGMTLLPAAQCESGVDRSAETDAAVKDAFAAAVRSLAPKPGGSGYNFDLPADHWVSQFAAAVRAVVRDESDRAAILATLLPWTNHQRVACDEREAAADRNLAAASARLAAARHFEMKAKQRVADASASLANLQADQPVVDLADDDSDIASERAELRRDAGGHVDSLEQSLGDADGELVLGVILVDPRGRIVVRHSSSPGSVCGASSVGEGNPSAGQSSDRPTTVSLHTAGKPVLSVTGTDASRVREAAAAIRAAESVAGA